MNQFILGSALLATLAIAPLEGARAIPVEPAGPTTIGTQSDCKCWPTFFHTNLAQCACELTFNGARMWGADCSEFPECNQLFPNNTCLGRITSVITDCPNPLDNINYGMVELENPCGGELATKIYDCPNPGGAPYPAWMSSLKCTDCQLQY